MDNDVPLRGAVHRRRLKVVTALAVVRPEFFAAGFISGSAGSYIIQVRLRFRRSGERIPTQVGKSDEYKRDQSEALIVHCFHFVSISKTRDCLEKKGVRIGLPVRVIPFVGQL
jgi:hypothetical protein